MKVILLLAFAFVSLSSFSQIPKSGSYIYKYCDYEYDHSCYSSCRVVIKGTHVVVYATKLLSLTRSGTKIGGVINQGIILKHKSGKWIIGKTPKDKYLKEITAEGPAVLDFKKKQYWTF